MNGKSEYLNKILVTGGAGYVGSQLVPDLLNRGYEVRVLDMFIFDDHVFEAVNNNNLELVRGDIRNRKDVDRCMRDIDCVIHLAAISNDASCELDQKLTKEVNCDAVAYLLKKAKEQGVRRFIFPSSASVYGVKEEDNVTEDSSLDPLTIYAKSKVEGEKLVLSHDSHDFTTTSIRAATLCGYSRRQRLDLTVNILTHHAVCRGKIKVFGGEQKRPNTNIHDIISIYNLMLQASKEKIGGKAFNAGFENYKIIEIANIVKKSVSSYADIEINPMTDYRSYHISSGKICEELGFRPRYAITDAIRELEAAFKNNMIPEPESSKYYNVKYMLEKNIK